MTPSKGRPTAVVIVVAAIAVFGAALASFVYLRRGETAQGGLDVAAWPDRPAAEAAPDLALSGNISWDQVYEGDPLWIRARIDSPRQRQLFNEAADRRVQSLPATPATFTMPAVGVRWGAVVTMRLAVVDAGGRAAPVFDGPATQFRIQARGAVPFAIEMPMRVEEWMLPAEATAGLRAGHYELTIAWPDAARPLTAAPIPYDVIAPNSNRQRAEHLGKHEVLPGAEVDHAVGDDHVDALVGEPDGPQVFHIAMVKAGVGPRVLEALGVPGGRVARQGELLLGHVDAVDPRANN